MDAQDPAIVNLTKAIALTESGQNGAPNYNAVGDNGTSHGAYQWQPGNFEAAARAAGLDPNDFSPANQNKVAYSQVKAYHDQGLNPAQIAAAWNSGEHAARTGSWQTNVGTTTINGKPISYDTPAYVQKVNTYYKQLAGANQPNAQPSAYNPKPYSTNPGEFDLSGAAPDATASATKPSFLQSLGNDASTAAKGVEQAATDTGTGKINPLSGLIQGAGAIAGGITSGINDTATHLPVVGGLVSGAEGLLGKAVGAAANTAPGKAIAGGVQSFSQNHPELAGDINGALNIASVVPVGKAIGAVKDIAGAALEGGTKDAVYDAVAPTLTKKATAEAVASGGTEKTGLLGKIKLANNANVQKIADTVKQYVPDFNPSGLVTDNIRKIQAVVDQLGTDLEQKVAALGKGRIYSPNELKGVLNTVQPGIEVKGEDAALKKFNLAKQAALDIANKNGGSVSSLLKTRKEFDALVNNEFPNLWDRTNAPMRKAISSVRDALTQFTEKRLPEGNGLKATLQTQSRLIKAIENMSSKASDEIGSDAVGRFAARHPVIKGSIGLLKRAVATGVGVRGAEELF